ncbi:MAG: phenylacetate--CoA ligase family protein, partial [Candidatus Binatia bacterium]
MYTTHADPESALRETLALARRSPFYGQHLAGADAGSLDGLRRLPFTTKDDLRATAPWGMMAVPREELWHYHESTGTTGEPIACWYRPEEFRIQGEAVARWFPEFVPGKILLDRFPSFAPISFCIESALQIRGGCHIACGNLSWDVPFPRALEFLRTLRPQIIGCLPLEMFLLWELAKSVGLEPSRDLDSLETAILAGAPLPAAMRRMVERDWSVRVREIYGSNETLFLGATCERGTLHLETTLYVAEVLDPETLEPVAPGTPGVFTLTHLGTKAMPLVRYLTRDMIRVVPCECGRAEPAIQLLGRQDEVVDYGGRRLYTNEILEAGYRLADANGSRTFFAVLRDSGVLYRVELDDPGRGLDPRTVAEIGDGLGVRVAAEAVRRGDILDPTALVRTPKVYKPAQTADWRRPGRKPLT